MVKHVYSFCIKLVSQGLYKYFYIFLNFNIQGKFYFSIFVYR